uniref:C2H2-type domain-containing protein n=1 Tax=Athene cunicularia TaxID=194338 RepID=A0A663LTJ5_ATHCN
DNTGSRGGDPDFFETTLLFILFQVGHMSSLQKEVGMNYSQMCSPRCSSAGPSGKQELPAELQREDKETYEPYYQKRGESTAGVAVPSGTNFDLQREDTGLEHCSSEQSKKPWRRLCGDNENTILADVFDEELEPISEEPLLYRCKKCGSSFECMSELQEHRRTHLVENSYRCPVCAKEFFRAANLRMHKLIHSSDRPHKCPECDKGFIRTADVWRHLQEKTEFKLLCYSLHRNLFYLNVFTHKETFHNKTVFCVL